MTSARLNLLSPVLTIRHLDGQCGSGQATSASVDIQSFLAEGRCFAAKSGRTEATNTRSEMFIILFRGENGSTVLARR